jgi:hypothetical protein
MSKNTTSAAASAKAAKAAAKAAQAAAKTSQPAPATLTPVSAPDASSDAQKQLKAMSERYEAFSRLSGVQLDTLAAIAKGILSVKAQLGQTPSEHFPAGDTEFTSRGTRTTNEVEKSASQRTAGQKAAFDLIQKARAFTKMCKAYNIQSAPFIRAKDTSKG